MNQMNPWRITLDTNPEDCNLNCLMCEEHSPYRTTPLPKPRRMEVDLVDQAIRQAANLGVKEVIPSTMGEPLIYAHFDRIMELCRELGLSLNLTTNGSFPKRGVLGWAEELIPLCSDIKVSVNGVTPGIQEQIMVKSNSPEHWKNIRQLVQVRDEFRKAGKRATNLTLQVTFMEMNLDEIPKLVKAAIDLGMERIKGHHLWVHGAEMKDQNLRRNKESIQRWNHTVDQVLDLVERYRLPNGQKLQLANIYHLDPKKPEELKAGGACPFLGKEIWVNPLGEFFPCCAPDEQRKSLGRFGNLTAQPLAGILQSNAYQHLLNNYQEQPLCRSCNMKV